MLLRDRLKTLLPQWLLRPVRSAFFWAFRRPPARLAPCEELFPALRKRSRRVPPRVDTPELLHMPLFERAEFLRGPEYAPPEDYITVVDDVLFSPANNVALTEDKQVLWETVNTGRVENMDLRELYTNRRARIEGYATPLRSLYNNYYHTLLDNLPRLLTLRSPLLAEHEIQLLYSGTLTSSESFYLDRLLPKNVTLRRVEAGVLYELEHLILTPFKTQRFSGYLPSHIRAPLRSLLLPSRPPARNRRLLISRESAAVRRLANHSLVEERLAPQGFETVRPETMTQNEQQELYYHAEMVIAPHGAGLANLLFAPAGTRVLELFATPYVVPHYYFLTTSLGQSYSYLCGDATERDPQSFETNVAAVEAIVRGWVRDRTEERNASAPSPARRSSPERITS